MPSAAQVGANLRKAVTQAFRMLALEIDSELRRRTPVDTGHARRNWIPSVGQPNTEEAASDAEHAAGVAEVIGYELAAGPLWVANVVGYIRALNYGHSTQQPAGWVELAVDVAMQKVQTKLRGRVDITALRSEFHSSTGGEAAQNLAAAYSPFGDD